MIIQYALSIVFIVLATYGVNQASRSRVVGAVILSSAILGSFFVWFPDYSTTVANFVGVGRGTDLVIYITAVTSLVVGFSIYLKLIACQTMITELARHVAISSPMIPQRLQGDLRSSPQPPSE